MSELLNKKVQVKKYVGEKLVFEGDVKIVDKVLMDKASYNKSAIINNSSMDVFLGRNLKDSDATSYSLVLFMPTDIVKVYF